MTTIGALKDRYTEVRERIARAAARIGRVESDVMLVAVTKNAEPDQIRDLVRLGHADFGENRVQQLVQRATIIDEWLGRHRTMPGVAGRGRSKGRGSGESWKGEAAGAGAGGGPPAVRWHMIGHLQRNKARKVVEMCRLIHSVDTLRLAEEVQTIAAKREKPVDVLLQVNCSGEPQKFGCAIAAAPHLAEQIGTMVQVRLRGLMTMAALDADPNAARATFGRCRELFDEVREQGIVSPDFNLLSMGMSGDFEAAIEEGSNLVRVGSALFGEGRVGEAGEEEE